MFKKRTMNVIIPMFLLIFSGYLYINKLPLIEKTYGINESSFLLDANEEDDTHSVEMLRKTYNNSEIIGYLEIPNTDFNRVVTQGKDNDKYLSHDAYGNKDIVGNPYLDYRVNISTDKKMLIYGHNSRTLDAPFKYLENYYDYEFFQNHKYISITTTKKKVTYEIFSVHIETKDWSYYNDIDFKSKEDWFNHITKLKMKSMYDTGVVVNEDDNILILQTCTTKEEYKNLKRKFLLIIAREVE